MPLFVSGRHLRGFEKSQPERLRDGKIIHRGHRQQSITPHRRDGPGALHQIPCGNHGSQGFHCLGYVSPHHADQRLSRLFVNDKIWDFRSLASFSDVATAKEKMTFPASGRVQSLKIFLLLLPFVLLMIWVGYLLKWNAHPLSKAFLVRDSMEGFPRTILWAWERPENLMFIDPKEVGVAFLAQTLYLRGGTLIVRPRFQPLHVPPQTSLIAVVRIESDRLEPPLLSLRQRLQTMNAIKQLARLQKIRAVQIDFDAKISERDFYRGLLNGLRKALDDSIPLSITALASWCIHDDWLSDLPIDEAVPMLFRMGVDQRQVSTYLGRQKDFPSKRCRKSLGISLDEPLPSLPSRSRVYVFNPRSWSGNDLDRIMRALPP